MIFMNRKERDSIEMNVTYKKLWKLLIDRDINKTSLQRMAGISTTTMAKLGKGNDVSLATLRKICSVLHCNIGDIVDVLPNTGGKHAD